MRKFFLTLAALMVTGTAAMLAPSSAGAAAIAPSAVQPAMADAAVVDHVAWIRRCHHHWRTSHVHCRPVWVPGYWHHNRHHRHHFYHRGHRHHHHHFHRHWHHRHYRGHRL
jgi:hypothetical protein